MAPPIPKKREPEVPVKPAGNNFTALRTGPTIIETPRAPAPPPAPVATPQTPRPPRPALGRITLREGHLEAYSERMVTGAIVGKATRDGGPTRELVALEAIITGFDPEVFLVREDHTPRSHGERPYVHVAGPMDREELTERYPILASVVPGF